MPNYFLFIILVIFFNPANALASEQTNSILENSSLSTEKVKTHYGMGYEQRMVVLNNQIHLSSGIARPVERIQKMHRPVRVSRPHRPVRPGR